MVRRNVSSDDIFISWARRKDIADMLRIEESIYEYPWDEDTFVNAVVKQSHAIGRFISFRNKLIGFACYETYEDKILITNFTIDKKYWRKGFGTILLNDVKKRLTKKRCRLFFELRDSNLQGHKFLQKNGFKAVEVVRKPYQYSDDDMYVFLYKNEKVKDDNTLSCEVA